MQDALEEREVALIAALLAIDLEHPPGAQACTGGLTSEKCPLVTRQLPVGVHVPLARQHHELLLGELGVDQRERDAVEGEIPGGVPGILHLSGIEMTS